MTRAVFINAFNVNSFGNVFHYVISKAQNMRKSEGNSYILNLQQMPPFSLYEWCRSCSDRCES